MKHSIPLFQLNYDEEEEKEILSTIRSKWLSLGPKCEELENAFCKELDTKYAISLANCTSALHLALLALGIKNGDEVICPSLSFVATANCIKYVGAIPKFCDIESIERPTINPVEIERLISSNTKAIIVMHYAGFACQMDEIQAIAKKHNLKIIEDACHGPLSEYKGKKLGSIGDVGCFSFYSNKNIAAGEGGMLTTSNKEIAEKIRLLRSHGMTTMSFDRFKGHATRYDVVELGYNYRMDDLRASLALVQLNKLKSDLLKRDEIRTRYNSKLSKHSKIVIAFENETSLSSNYIYSIVLKNSTSAIRDKVREELQIKGIQTSVHYPAIHLFSIYEAESNPLKETEYYSDNTLTLPMYGGLKEEEVDYICDSLLSVLDEL